MVKSFKTLVDACAYMQDEQLNGTHRIEGSYALGWLVVRNDDLDEQPDAHFGALSRHTPFTPDPECEECQRAGWVTLVSEDQTDADRGWISEMWNVLLKAS